MKKELRREPVRDDKIVNGKKVESWRAYFDYYDENGKLKTYKPRFPTKRKAAAQIELFKQEETRNRKFVKPGEKVRFKWYCEQYAIPEMEKRLSPTSIEGELARLRAAIEFFGDATIESITRLRIKNYKEHLEQQTAKGRKTKLSPTTVNRYIERLRAVLHEAQADFPELPPVNVKKGIVERKKEIKRERTISFAEFDRLLDACTGNQAYLRLYVIALWETGARPGEIKGNKDNPRFLPGVQRKDIDFENQTILLWNSKLHPGKEPEQRTAYLSEFLREEMIKAGVDKLEPDAYVFLGDTGKRFFDPKKGWSIIKERAGIDETEKPGVKNSGVFTQKDVRHCFTNNADDAGVQKSVIAHQINHDADSDLLGSVYIHQRAEFLRRKFERFEIHSKEQRAFVEAEKRKQTAPAIVYEIERFEYEIERFERAA